MTEWRFTRKFIRFLSIIFSRLLLIHYFHALQKVVERKDVDETLKENMSYHCVQICRIITQHKIYFQRVRPDHFVFILRFAECRFYHIRNS